MKLVLNPEFYGDKALNLVASGSAGSKEYFENLSRGEMVFMSRLRNRILLSLITYFAGFATAIYTLAPSHDADGGSKKNEFHNKEVSSKSEDFALKFNSSMRKCLSIAEEKAVEIGQTVKVKLSERYKDREG